MDDIDEELGINFEEKKSYGKNIYYPPKFYLSSHKNCFNVSENCKCNILNPYIIRCGKENIKGKKYKSIFIFGLHKKYFIYIFQEFIVIKLNGNRIFPKLVS